MNDIQAFELDANIDTNRDMHLIGRLKGLGRIGIIVDELPPPLLAANLDRETGILGHAEAARCIEARNRQTRDDDNGRRDGRRHQLTHPLLSLGV